MASWRQRAAMGDSAALRQAVPAAACLGAAALAQWALDRRLAPGVAGGLSVAAGLGFGALSGAWRQAKQSPPTARISWGPRDSAAFAGLAVLAVAAWVRLGGNRFSSIALATWLPGFALLGMATWEPDIGRRLAAWWRRLRGAGGITLRWPHLALLGAMAVAAFLRLYRIAEVPLEMGCDLPHNYDNIRQILAGEAPIFFP